MRLRTTALIVLGKNNTILGVSRKDNYNIWTLPGGKTENGESTVRCACRELEEETGLHATSMNLVDIRGYDNIYVSPVSHDEVWLYKVNTYTGELRSDEESIALGEGLVKWCTKQELIDGPFGDYNAQLFAELEERKVI